MARWVSEFPKKDVPVPYSYGFFYYIENGFAWKQYVELSEWCWQHFGDEGLRWKQEKMNFWFRDFEDATEFKLRWL